MHTMTRVSLAGLLLLAGCATPPTGGGGGGPAPTPSPSASPPPAAQSARVQVDFEGWAMGPLASDAPFVDVASELREQGLVVPTWLYRGSWEIVDLASGSLRGRVLRQSKVQERPPVTLLRYRGPMGSLTDGKMPDRYRMVVTQQPVRSPYNMPPTGDQGIQPYYLDANHYVEVVTTPTQLQVWTCDGGAPDTASGWTKHWETELTTRAGDTRRIGAVVDVAKGTFTVLYDDQPQATVTSPLIAPGKGHGVALRAIGNEVNFDDLVMETQP